jgi:hypothetical protein
MRYFVYTVIAVLLLIATACKKEETKVNTTKTPAATGVALKDFNMVPIKDASWKIHIQGMYNNEHKMDTTFHAFVTVAAMDEDTQVNSLTYHKYKVNWSASNNSGTSFTPKVFTVYVREDTPARVLYTTATLFEETPLISLRDDSVGKIVNQKPQWEIKYVDSIVMAGQYLKRWQACNSHDRNLEYLYKAYGVVSPTGPVLRSYVMYEGGQVVSTEFTYKIYTQKFINNVIF